MNMDEKPVGTLRPNTRAIYSSHASWYVAAMEYFVMVVQDLFYARTQDEIIHIVRDAARNLTGTDGSTFILRDGDQCYYVDENAISPLWKGKRFPMEACISGWVMQNAATTFIEDIYADDRIPHAAYKPTFVKSLVMVPIGGHNPVGAIGNYWAEKRVPLPEEIALLESLANVTATALMHVTKLADLEKRALVNA